MPMEVEETDLTSFNEDSNSDIQVEESEEEILVDPVSATVQNLPTYYLKSELEDILFQEIRKEKQQEEKFAQILELEEIIPEVFEVPQQRKKKRKVEKLEVDLPHKKSNKLNLLLEKLTDAKEADDRLNRLLDM
jgi:hypothetical protein